MTRQTLDDTIAERASQYGDYAVECTTTQKVKEVLRNNPGWDNLNNTQKQALEMCALKMARIVNGNPDNYDSWHDLAGYAQLGRDHPTHASRNA